MQQQQLPGHEAIGPGPATAPPAAAQRPGGARPRGPQPGGPRAPGIPRTPAWGGTLRPRAPSWGARVRDPFRDPSPPSGPQPGGPMPGTPSGTPAHTPHVWSACRAFSYKRRSLCNVGKRGVPRRGKPCAPHGPRPSCPDQRILQRFTMYISKVSPDPGNPAWFQ